MATSMQPHANDVLAEHGTQLRQIPLSRIVVADGFNPRGEVVSSRFACARARTVITC